jgi:hypothetical protein
MIRGRGQSPRRMVDRDFPHQVLVSADLVRGLILNKVDHFHTQMGIPMKSHLIRRDDFWWTIYCFANRRHADAFHLIFGGELFEARSPKGRELAKTR